MLEFSDNSQGHKNLSEEEKQELEEKLKVCVSIANNNTRQLVLNRLRPEIRESIPISDNVTTIVGYIIDTCLNYTLGLQELSEQINFREGASKPWHDFNNYLHSLFPNIIITYTHFVALKNIVVPGLEREDNWTKETIKNIYAASVPNGNPPSENIDRLNMLDYILQDLTENGKGTDGSVPLLSFVAGLIKMTNEPVINERLTLWLQRTANDLSVKPSLLEVKGSSKKKFFSSLQVALQPDKENEQAPFRVWAWLCTEQSIESPLQIGEKWYEFSALPKLLGELLDESEKRIPNKEEKLLVELFLPNALLGFDFEQLKIEYGTKSRFRLLINMYPIVVRSLNRPKIENNIFINDWERFWHTFDSREGNMELAFFSEENCKTEDFIEVLSSNLLLGKLPVFTCVPSQVRSPYEADIFEVITDAATPSALWLRSQPVGFDEKKFRESAEAFLVNSNFSRLPEILWEERVKAIGAGNQRHPARYLTLLWDSPSRVPDALRSDELIIPGVNGEEIVQNR
jgi:hypothetical protein